jgi:hypothetical protein
MSNGPMEVISPFVLRAMACDIEEMQSPQAWADRCRAAAAEIERLRAERRAMQGALLAIKAHTQDAHPMSYIDQLCRIARAALGEKK